MTAPLIFCKISPHIQDFQLLLLTLPLGKRKKIPKKRKIFFGNCSHKIRVKYREKIVSVCFFIYLTSFVSTISEASYCFICQCWTVFSVLFISLRYLFGNLHIISGSAVVDIYASYLVFIKFARLFFLWKVPQFGPLGPWGQTPYLKAPGAKPRILNFAAAR